MTAPPDGDSTITLTVTDREVITANQDVVALTLARADGGPLPAWHPGAHIDLLLPSGRMRQYSLCGDPLHRDRYRVAVRRIPCGGGGSAEVHDGLRLGNTLTTQGPRNAFPLTVPGHGSPAKRFRFIAGGIGITPILSMLGYATRLGVDWSMVYTGRTRDSLPFLDEVAAFGDRVEIRTDDVAGTPTVAELLGDCPPHTAVYACGPAPMLTAIRSRLDGRSDIALHFERFTAPPVVDGDEFSAEITSVDTTVQVGAEETLLGALNRSGITVPYSCQQGFCGTCRIRVVDGPVDHRDALLTDPERADGMMLACISRAGKGQRLTLDI